MRSHGMITVADVARKARVAAATASFVLNGGASGTRVSEGTRARIMDAAAQLGYRPNGVARALARGCTDTIRIAVSVSAATSIYFREILTGALDEAAQQTWVVNVFPVTGNDIDSPGSLLQRCCDGRADGLILATPFNVDQDYLAAVCSRMPIVAVHGTESGSGADRVEIDVEAGMVAAMSHLISLGHRRIAYLPGARDWPGIEEKRLSGYRRALRANGVLEDSGLIRVTGESGGRDGRERTFQLLEEVAAWPEALRPTAIACGDDVTASGCLSGLARRGLRVPDDISVTGFGDISASCSEAIALTTVRLPFREVGRRAVRILRERIEFVPSPSERPASQTITLDVTLIVRSTSCCRIGQFTSHIP